MQMISSARLLERELLRTGLGGERMENERKAVSSWRLDV
jgi:hypothetical protein